MFGKGHKSTNGKKKQHQQLDQEHEHEHEQGQERPGNNSYMDFLNREGLYGLGINLHDSTSSDTQLIKVGNVRVKEVSNALLDSESETHSILSRKKSIKPEVCDGLRSAWSPDTTYDQQDSDEEDYDEPKEIQQQTYNDISPAISELPTMYTPRLSKLVTSEPSSSSDKFEAHPLLHVLSPKNHILSENAIDTNDDLLHAATAEWGWIVPIIESGDPNAVNPRIRLHKRNDTDNNNNNNNNHEIMSNCSAHSSKSSLFERDQRRLSSPATSPTTSIREKRTRESLKQSTPLSRFLGTDRIRTEHSNKSFNSNSNSNNNNNNNNNNNRTSPSVKSPHEHVIDTTNNVKSATAQRNSQAPKQTISLINRQKHLEQFHDDDDDYEEEQEKHETTEHEDAHQNSKKTTSSNNIFRRVYNNLKKSRSAPDSMQMSCHAIQ